MRLAIAILAGLSIGYSSLAASPSPGDPPDGAALYAQRCAACHDNPTDRIPPKRIIAMMQPSEDVIRTLTSGIMREKAAGLGPDQIRAIAVFITGKQPGAVSGPDPQANMCPDKPSQIRLDAPQWNGWGADPQNSRFQPRSGLTAGDVPKLKVKWAFAYPGIAYGQPTVVGDRLYVTTRTGRIFSLNAKSGCTYWSDDVGAPIRTAVSIGPVAGTGSAKFAAYFSDERGFAHAVDAASGKPLWKTRIDDHAVVRLIGAPKLYKNRLYVPVSSMEEVAAGVEPKYACCTFRGSVVALDATTGKILWKNYAIAEKPKPTKINSLGNQMYGPAGAAIWNSPTIDAKRNLLYVGTGDSYTDVENDGSDAVVAFDLKTGQRKWASQVRPKDNWVMTCRGQTTGNCPSPVGPDFDFGSSPVLRTLPNGKDVILAAAKSTVVYAMDPDDRGCILWQVKLGEGSGGGVIWGPGADTEKLYVALADPNPKQPGHVAGGLTALNPTTGEQLWHTAAPAAVCGWGTEHCSPAQPAAIAIIPGIVFSGSLDGHMRAYSTKDGAIVWDFDTAKTYQAVNGAEAAGGNLDGGAQTVADGVLYVNSGNVTFTSPHPGNALLAFTVDGR